jgi:hypothetical protein
MAFYSREVMLAAEAHLIRERAEHAGLEAARAAAFQRELAEYQKTLPYRIIASAMDCAQECAERSGPRYSASALLAFEMQWNRERKRLRARGQRISGYDAAEQMVRRIRLWRVAGVLTWRHVGSTVTGGATD